MARTTTTAARVVTPSKRTTAAKPRKPKVDLDLDAVLADELEEEGEAETRTFQMGGETYTVRCSVNAFLLSAALGGDNEALTKFFESLMPVGDFRRFKQAMSDHPNMSNERYGKIFARVLELVSERPTN